MSDFGVCKVNENSLEDKSLFVDYLEAKMNDSSQFVPITTDPITISDNDPKVIAWYLPQFYRIKSNDEIYGRGFTEWSNSSKAFPMFVGHYQPHIPYDVGYYNLNTSEPIARQAELAAQYGIYGFCIHYYWFSGERTMEKPLDLLLNDKSINIKYCLNWATENWIAKWNGGNGRVIHEQRIRDDDPEKFVDDIIPYFADERYIRIKNKPLLMIYNIKFDNAERVKYMIDGIRTILRERGMGEVFILITNRYGIPENVDQMGIDGIVEYPINDYLFNHCKRLEYKGYLNSSFHGKLFDFRDYVLNRRYEHSYTYSNIYHSAAVGFDDSPRYKYGARVFSGLTPDVYEDWLLDSMIKNRKQFEAGNDYTFVGSWNEWAESSHLEPDYKYGYAYLQATKNAIIKMRSI